MEVVVVESFDGPYVVGGESHIEEHKEDILPGNGRKRCRYIEGSNASKGRVGEGIGKSFSLNINDIISHLAAFDAFLFVGDSVGGNLGRRYVE